MPLSSRIIRYVRDGWTDIQTDRQTPDGRTDRRTDGQKQRLLFPSLRVGRGIISSYVQTSKPLITDAWYGQAVSNLALEVIRW